MVLFNGSAFFVVVLNQKANGVHQVCDALNGDSGEISGLDLGWLNIEMKEIEPRRVKR